MRNTRKAALGVGAVFITQFISFLFLNARNTAQPGMIAELDGMTLFSWLIALPALAGAAGTLLSGKLSDVYGRRIVLLASIGIFLLGLGFAAAATSMTWLVAQFAVPRRLLGSAVGAVFFFQMVGIAVAPSLLGLLQRSVPTLEIGLKLVFLAGALALLAGLLIILTIPQISMEGETVETDEPLQAVPAE